jgi:transcriptional regulator with XRE-family HTH domain
MISRQEIVIRNKITGVLLRSARARARKSVQECAAALPLDPAFIERAEEGREGLTLPQLESLAQVLQVPVGYLLGEEELPTDQAAPEPLLYENVMTVRRKIIGVILRQARLESGQTLDDTATILGYAPERLAQVELGEEPITLVELQVLAQALGIPFETFIAEDIIPLTPEERAKRDVRQLAHLPADVREFVLKPINVPYLQVALNLSQMPAETLRQLASGLFEITY